MRAGILSLALLSLLAGVSARPAGMQNERRNGGQPSITFTEPVPAPTTESRVLVFKNNKGNVIRTTTQVVAIVPEATGVVVAAPRPSPSGESRAESPQRGNGEVSVAGNGAKKFGVAYSPYLRSGDCKKADQVLADFKELSKTYSLARIYGTDCNQVANVLAAAKTTNVKVFLGVFGEVKGADGKPKFVRSKVKDELKILIKDVAGNWKLVDTVSVGNEVVNFNKGSTADVLWAMDEVRKAVRANDGADVPVVTTDTWVATLSHPELCNKADYCAFNMHAFFDGKVAAAGAGEWMKKQIGAVKAAVSNKGRLVVTEAGWPWKGKANGQAQVSPGDQEAALGSMRTAFAQDPQNLILLSAYNDEWKGDGDLGVEKWWGIGASKAVAPSESSRKNK